MDLCTQTTQRVCYTSVHMWNIGWRSFPINHPFALMFCNHNSCVCRVEYIKYTYGGDMKVLLINNNLHVNSSFEA